MLKDTVRNIAARGEFVVNLVSLSQARRMNVTSIDFAAHIDETVEAGIEWAPSRLLEVPRIAGSPTSFDDERKRFMTLCVSRATRKFPVLDLSGGLRSLLSIVSLA